MTGRFQVFKAIALFAAFIILTVTTSGCGGGGSSSGSAYWGGGDGGGSATTSPQITAVSNLDLPGQPIRVGDWIQIEGSGFGDTRLGTTSDGCVVFSDDVTETKAISYGRWTDTLVECQVPQDAPIKAMMSREKFNIIVLSCNTPFYYYLTHYSVNGNPTPNPSPESTPPSPSPSLSPSVYPTPSPSPTPTPTPSSFPVPSPTQTSSGGGGGGGGGVVTPVATKLGFTVQPSDVTLAEAIAPAVKVAIQDASGNTVTTSTDNITVALDPNGTGAALSGTLTKPAVNGVATFDNLAVDKTGSGYTLTATSGTLTAATSGAFSVSNVLSITKVTSYCSGPGPSNPAKDGNGNVNFIPNGDKDTKVIIEGTGFGGAQGTGKVTFKGATGAEKEALIATGGWTDTSIECTVPSVDSLVTELNTGTGEVKVTTSTAKSSSKPFVVCPDGMTYVPADWQGDGAINELYMGECEVTNGEFDNDTPVTGFKTYLATYVTTTPHSPGFAGNNRPAENLSWYMAVVYCNWKTIQEFGDDTQRCYNIQSNSDDEPSVTYRSASFKGYRLADTAGTTNQSEWEYACRAGTSTFYYWGDVFGATNSPYCWYINNTLSCTSDVGKKIPNLWGLYDISGNVWEWTNEPNGSNRVLRGGSWADSGNSCRSFDINVGEHWRRYTNYGFRILRTK